MSPKYIKVSSLTKTTGNKRTSWEFPSSSMVGRTWSFHCWGPGSIPGQATKIQKIQQALWVAQKIKKNIFSLAIIINSQIWNCRDFSGCPTAKTPQFQGRGPVLDPWSGKVKVKSLSHVRFFATPWTVAYQASLSMGFSRQEYWSGLPFPSPGDLPGN